MRDMAAETAALQGWVGRSETVEDEAALPIVRRLAALLDRDAMALRRGDALPEGWHAVFFGPLAPQSQLGPDGHPRKGDFLPPVPLPRRMFAGRRIRFLAPLPIGAALRRTSTIAAVTPKTGRSGQMVFVRVDHSIEADGKVVVTEEHDIVYREEAGKAAGAAPAPAAAPAPLPEPTATEDYAPDTVTLFRYSAVTFNGHRIHYDQPYTTQEEGYPALVVNGGLTALRLCELAKRHLPGGRIGRLSVRNVRPFFVGRKGELRCRQEAEGRLVLWALDEQGRPIAEGEATA
ncbi:MAG TPA: MaoC family dehydratase N-terminal domain-containing protein [Roseomonas sp.]|nr:MaoC family dehydratase N-terminal domain-containing protein [Roseomonas sp.]